MLKIDTNFSRRAFIDRSVKATLGFLSYPLFKKSSLMARNIMNDRATVVVVKDENAGKIEYEGARKLYNVNQEVAQVMLDAGIRQLTGYEDVGEAWKSLFPVLSQNKVIGIKINCIARQDNTNGLASHPEVINSIVNGLLQMQVEGKSFPAENIIIWDRSEFEMERAGFVINRSDTGVKCFGTRYEIMREGEDAEGYSTTEAYNIQGVQQYLSKIPVEQCDYLINTCLFKDHVYSGVTFSLKNHYGSCWAPRKMHGGYCNPYIAQLNALPPIKEKQVLCIADAIYGIKSGGPMGPPQIAPNTLILSQDSVALDTIGYDMLKTLGTPNYTLGKAKYIATAATDPYNLGINDLNRIDRIDINNPSTGINDGSRSKKKSADFLLFQNFPNPFNGQTTISYQLYQPSRIKIKIFNIQGSLIRTLVNEYQNGGDYQISWDGRDSDGMPVPGGNYLGRILVNNVQQTIRMSLIK